MLPEANILTFLCSSYSQFLKIHEFEIMFGLQKQIHFQHQKKNETILLVPCHLPQHAEVVDCKVDNLFHLDPPLFLHQSQSTSDSTKVVSLRFLKMKHIYQLIQILGNEFKNYGHFSSLFDTYDRYGVHSIMITPYQ